MNYSYPTTPLPGAAEYSDGRLYRFTRFVGLRPSILKISLAAVSAVLATAPASAQSWSYGILTDTQGAGAYPDVSTRLMAPVVDRFIHTHEVDMILSVGDLTDVGSSSENTLWLDTAKPIYDAGIPTYIQRGNHDIKTEATITGTDPVFGEVELADSTIWDDQIPLPSNPTLVEGPGTSYYFTFNNMFVVSLDLYGVAPSNLIGWLQGTALPAAVASGTEHRVLVQHAPYFGKARDGVLQGDENGDPALELSLLEGMAQAGIDTIYTGHDHQYSRSVAVDATGDVLLNHIVVGSNSEKYYRFEQAEGPNERQIVQINDLVGYSIVEVDGPKVTFSHYTSEAPDPTTTDSWTPNWTLSDQLVFSTEGHRFLVAPNDDFSGISSTSQNGTEASIVSGTNATFGSQMTAPDPGTDPELVQFSSLVEMGWLDGSSDSQVQGDVLVLDGLANEPMGKESELYRLEMTYTEAPGIDESTLSLAVYDATSGTWMDARMANIVDSAGSAAASAESGVDTGENMVWAELNHNANGTRFAVVSEAASATSPIGLSRLGSYESGVFDESATEIPAFDSGSQRAFVTNASVGSVDIIDFSDPANPSKIGSFIFSNIDGKAYSPNSVAVSNGTVAVALEAASVNEKGIVALYDAAVAISPTIAPLVTVEAGYLPDMLTFTPDGSEILVANEGEASQTLDGSGAPDFNPEGSITIIPVTGNGASASVGTPTQLDFALFEPGGSLELGSTLAAIKAPADATGPAKVRIHPNAASVAEDLEPEYITVAPDGNTAYAALQENNAIITIDLANEQITGIFPLGYKDHSLQANALDADKNDDDFQILPQPFYGIYMPDAISSYEVGGQVYIVTANEGDGRDPDDFGDFPGNGLGDEADLKDLDLDDALFPNEDTLTDGKGLGDLGSFSFGGDLDNDGDVDQILIPGARSFSVWNAATGELVFDSGGDFERITAQLLPENFNASNDDNSIDDRSDNKGPEPEAVQLAEIAGRTIAFIALERVSGIMIYDITDPAAPIFINYVNDREFSVAPENSSDVGPEGFAFVPANESPNGEPLLLVASEVSGSLTAYQIEVGAQAAWNLTLLHHNDGESKLPEYSESFPAYGNVARMKSAIDAHRNFYEGLDHAVLSVYAGDSFLAGKQFQASVDSDPQVYYDALALSQVGYDAIAIGNHEFDFGPSVLADFIEDAQSVQPVPFLSSNLDFSAEPDLQALVDSGNIAKSTTVILATPDGDKTIGIIGATTENLPFVSSPGSVTASNVAAAVNAEASTLAGSTDAIILVSHLQGISEDEALAPLLVNVDAIVAGGGDEILGTTAVLSPRAVYGLAAPANAADTGLVPSDSFNAAGLSYPVVVNDIPIVTSGGNYGYLGRLTLRFDANNEMIGIDISSGPATILSETIDPTNGYAADGTMETDVVDPVVAFTDAIDNEIIGVTDNTIIGGTDKDLIRSAEQNGGNLVADAQLAAAQARATDFGVDVPQIAIANGGGIRADIAAGPISVGNTFEVSPFGNFVSIIENVSTEDLKLLLENAYSRTLDNDPSAAVEPLRQGGGTGRFAQISGMEVVYDISRDPLVLDDDTESITQAGTRVIEARLTDGTPLILGGVPVAGTTVDLVLPSFNADGGDQYFRFGFGAGFYTSQEYIKTTVGITDQQALQDYIEGFGFDKIDSDPRYDHTPDGRIRAVSDRDNDGLSDADELTVGTDPDVPDQTNPVAETYTQAGQDEVTNNPSTFGLYTQSELDDNFTAGQQTVVDSPQSFGLSDVPVAGLRIDGQALELDSGTSNATFQVEVQATPDLSQPFTKAGEATVTLDFSESSQFIRVQAVEQSP